MGLQTGRPARNNGTQDVQFLRQRITFDGTSGLIYSADRDGLGAGIFYLGTIPNGALIVSPISGTDVNTVFNAGTNNRLNIGISGTAAKYAATSSLLTAGFVAMGVAVGHRVAADTQIIVTLDITGTAPTTGDIELVLAFVNPN